MDITCTGLLCVGVSFALFFFFFFFFFLKKKKRSVDFFDTQRPLDVCLSRRPKFSCPFRT